MGRLGLLLIATAATLAADDPPTVPFDAPKYGLRADLPKGWDVAIREEDEYVFVAKVPRDDPDRPGAAACELGLAPESLDEYRTRIDASSRRGDRPGTLVRNEVLKDDRGERLETLRELRPAPGVTWRELTIRVIRNRQMYTYTLSLDADGWDAARAQFERLVGSVEYHPPNTGADPLDPARNRWVQREFRFALDLPDGWRPALAPDEVALFYANGPARGIWADNVLVIAQPRRPLDLKALAETLPDQLLRVDAGCEVLACKVIKQGDREALETAVRTKRGPFSMTVLERRFQGERFNYETKFTVESERYDALLPALRKALDSFEEVPGEVPAAGRSKPA